MQRWTKSSSLFLRNAHRPRQRPPNVPLHSLHHRCLLVSLISLRSPPALAAGFYAYFLNFSLANPPRLSFSTFSRSHSFWPGNRPLVPICTASAASVALTISLAPSVATTRAVLRPSSSQRNNAGTRALKLLPAFLPLSRPVTRILSKLSEQHPQTPSIWTPARDSRPSLVLPLPWRTAVITTTTMPTGLPRPTPTMRTN